MKKLFIMLLAFAASILMLAGCDNGSGADIQNGTDTKETSGGKESRPENPGGGEKGFIFKFNEKEVYCNQSATDALAALGEFSNKLESPSCAFNGMEVTYYYSSIQLITYTDGQSPEKVLSIYLQDDTVSTAEGITIGDSADKVRTTYGEPYESSDSSMIFVKDKTKLTFVFNDDVVSSVTYLLIFD